MHLYTQHEIPFRTHTHSMRVPNYKNQIIRREFEIGYIWMPKTNQLQCQSLDRRIDE